MKSSLTLLKFQFNYFIKQFEFILIITFSLNKLIFASLLTKYIAAISKLFLAHKCNRESPFESTVSISHPFDINKFGKDSL